MSPNYPHTAMIIIGVIQIVLGAESLVPCSMGLNNYFQLYRRLSHIDKKYDPYLYWLIYIIGSSIGIMLNGCIGTSAGVRIKKRQLTNRRKIGYIVGSIMTPAAFSWPAAYIQISHTYLYMSKSLGIIVLINNIAGGILSIVSASICCCATSVNSIGNAQTTPAVNTTVNYSANNYPPISYPGNYPPGAYPPGNYPTGQNPSAAYPPGNLPPGAYPPGNNPPGNPAPKDLQAPEADSNNPV